MKKANCITLKKLGILFAVVLQASLSNAGDDKDETGKALSMPGIILTVTANNPSEWGAANGPNLFIKNKNIFPAQFSDMMLQQPNKKGFYHEMGKAIDQISGYFFKYFSVEDYSSNNPEPRFQLKNKIRTFNETKKDFDLNLAFNIGYHNPDNLNIDAIRIESFFHDTFVTTIYHYEKKELEIGLSNVMINNLLLDGMKLEIQTNPDMNSGALLFTMAM